MCISCKCDCEVMEYLKLITRLLLWCSTEDISWLYKPIPLTSKFWLVIISYQFTEVATHMVFE